MDLTPIVRLCFMAQLTVNFKIDYPGGSELISWALSRAEFSPADHSIGSQRFKAENDSVPCCLR